jgi:hypothetical protein
VTGLLPHVIRQAVQGKSVSAASASFGVVALVLLFVVLVEWEAMRLIRPSSKRLIGLSVVSAPLLVVTVLTIIARIALLVH